jgi:hypothetical protein
VNKFEGERPLVRPKGREQDIPSVCVCLCVCVCVCVFVFVWGGGTYLVETVSWNVYVGLCVTSFQAFH